MRVVPTVTLASIVLLSTLGCKTRQETPAASAVKSDGIGGNAAALLGTLEESLEAQEEALAAAGVALPETTGLALAEGDDRAQLLELAARLDALSDDQVRGDKDRVRGMVNDLRALAELTGGLDAEDRTRVQRVAAKVAAVLDAPAPTPPPPPPPRPTPPPPPPKEPPAVRCTGGSACNGDFRDLDRGVDSCDCIWGVKCLNTPTRTGYCRLPIDCSRSEEYNCGGYGYQWDCVCMYWGFCKKSKTGYCR